jgi:hypothetical protein
MTPGHNGSYPHPYVRDEDSNALAIVSFTCKKLTHADTRTSGSVKQIRPQLRASRLPKPHRVAREAAHLWAQHEPPVVANPRRRLVGAPNPPELVVVAVKPP